MELLSWRTLRRPPTTYRARYFSVLNSFQLQNPFVSFASRASLYVTHLVYFILPLFLCVCSCFLSCSLKTRNLRDSLITRAHRHIASLWQRLHNFGHRTNLSIFRFSRPTYQPIISPRLSISLAISTPISTSISLLFWMRLRSQKLGGDGDWSINSDASKSAENIIRSMLQDIWFHSHRDSIPEAFVRAIFFKKFKR